MAASSVAFFGASTGVGLAALKQSLAAGRQCVALCRTPSKLTETVDPKTSPGLTVIQGNAHDKADVSKCLKSSDGHLVDEIVFTIGAKFDSSKFAIDDVNVCEKGINTVLAALADLRIQGCTGNPHIIVMSSTGISKFGRDTPLLVVPMYTLLKIPHRDKRALEEIVAASGEAFTIVRGSLLVNGESQKVVRVGVEDPKSGIESKAIGYTISREDTGKWIADNLVLSRKPEYVNKSVTVTY